LKRGKRCPLSWLSSVTGCPFLDILLLGLSVEELARSVGVQNTLKLLELAKTRIEEAERRVREHGQQG